MMISSVVLYLGMEFKIAFMERDSVEANSVRLMFILLTTYTSDEIARHLRCTLQMYRKSGCRPKSVVQWQPVIAVSGECREGRCTLMCDQMHVSIPVDA